MGETSYSIIYRKAFTMTVCGNEVLANSSPFKKFEYVAAGITSQVTVNSYTSLITTTHDLTITDEECTIN